MSRVALPLVLLAACTNSPVWIAQPLNEASFTPGDEIDLHAIFALPLAQTYSFCDTTPCSGDGNSGNVRIQVEVTVAGSPVPFADLLTDALGDVRGDITSYAEEGWNEVSVGWRVVGGDGPPRWGGPNRALASFFLEGPPEDPPPSPLLGGRIGEDGGTLSVPDGSVAVEVPPGALADDTYLQVELDPVDLPGIVGPTVVLSPETLALDAAATLRIRWATDSAVADAAALRLARFEEDGTWQELATSSADVAAGVASGSIDRLGRYTVIDCGAQASRDPKVVCAADRDGDGDGFSVTASDCDDANPLVHPGAPEACDGLDNDCDGLIDDADDVVAPEDPGAWYTDGDGDGAGDDATGRAWCTPPEGAVRAGGDCDDANPARSPTTPEACNDADDDCDGVIDEDLVIPAWYPDGDGDGVGAGASTLACEQPEGSSATDGDCDDADPARTPGAEEICDDGVDNDCDAATTEVCP